MEKVLENGFHLVFSTQDLKEVIKFLKSGFGWNEIRSTALYRRLEDQNDDFPKAAMYVDKGNISIGILLFHQGFDDKNMKDVINIASWYGKESHRGVPALKFAKNLTSALDEFVITDYTPTFVVSKILKTLKYEDMAVRNNFMGAQRNFPFFSFNIRLKDISFRQNAIAPINIEKFNKKYDSAEWLYKLSKIRRFGISVTVLSLFSLGKKQPFDFIWILKMVFKHRVLRVNLFMRDENDLTRDVWLIKNPNEDLFVPPINSELSI